VAEKEHNTYYFKTVVSSLPSLIPASTILRSAIFGFSAV
jgi:hypothetical protein